MKGDEALRLTAGAGEFVEVALKLAVVAKRLKALAEEAGDDGRERGVDPVVHPLAVPPGEHQAAAAKVSQMAGDLGLALRENFDEVADADLTAMHQVQQAQAGSVGKRGKHGDHVVDRCRSGG